MNQFSISQLAQFSGIKAHTIRIWEQRYNALQPNRSEGNTRYYDNSQLRRLLNIVSLSKQDYKVSELSAMSDNELFQLVAETTKQIDNESASYFIYQIIAAGISFDEVYFDKIFSHCLIRLGLRDTYLSVIYPTLARIGLMWTSDTLPPAQEHFISNLFRQKLFTAIDSLPPAKNDADSWLLFLPENEFHELGLLFAHYLISLAGHKVIYLGSNVPFPSFGEMAREIPVNNILLFLVHNYSDEEVIQLLADMTTIFTGKKIFVACQQQISDSTRISKEINWLSSVIDLEQIL